MCTYIYIHMYIYIYVYIHIRMYIYIPSAAPYSASAISEVCASRNLSFWKLQMAFSVQVCPLASRPGLDPVGRGHPLRHPHFQGFGLTFTQKVQTYHDSDVLFRVFDATLAKRV